MSEWKETEIGMLPITWDVGELQDLAEIIDPHPSHRAPEIYDGGVPFAGIGDIEENGDIIIHKARKVSPKIIIEHEARYSINENTIGYGRVGTVGKVVKLKPQNYKYCLSPTLAVISPKKETTAKFLYSLIRDMSFYSRVSENMTGSTRPAIGIQLLRKIRVPIPPLPEQKAIAEVLSSLDDKIDLLHRQNKTLEQMAETLFRQWFVEEAEEDWEEVSLYEAIILVGGGTPKTSINEYWNGDIKWLSGGDITTNHKSLITTSEKSITDEGLNNSSAKLLPRFSTVISARGTVGKYCILSEPMAFSQSNYGIKPKFEDCNFFTYLLINHSVEDLQSAAYGSVFDTITTETFKGYDIKLPKEVEIKAFEQDVTSYFQKKLNNQKQIRTLEKMRDTLLPKLMSGEVRVKTD